MRFLKVLTFLTFYQHWNSPPENTSYIMCDNKSPWCGQKGGEYKVHSILLSENQDIMIEKKLHKFSDKYFDNVMSCMWIQYYCLTGHRSVLLKSVQFIEPEASEMGEQFAVTEYGTFTGYSVLVGDIVTPFELIYSDQCPEGEYLYNNYTEMIKVRKKYKGRIFNIRDVHLNIIKNKNITVWNKLIEFIHISQLIPPKNGFCFEKLNICKLSQLHYVFGYKILEVNDINVNNKYQCSIFGLSSKLQTLIEIINRSFCNNRYQYTEPYILYVIRMLFVNGLFPKPNINLELIDEKSKYNKSISISCSNLLLNCMDIRKERYDLKSRIIINFYNNNILYNNSTITGILYKIMYSLYTRKSIFTVYGLNTIYTKNYNESYLTFTESNINGTSMLQYYIPLNYIDINSISQIICQYEYNERVQYSSDIYDINV